MTREELDFIGSMNMCDEISNEAYKKIVCHCEGQEPCENAISRQAAIESIKNLYPDMPIVDIMGSRQKWLNKYAPYIECEHAIERSPSVNPQPKTGRWIEHEIDDVCRWLECSNCHYETYNVKHNYCMNCGAKMVEPQERSE